MNYSTQIVLPEQHSAIYSIKSFKW